MALVGRSPRPPLAIALAAAVAAGCSSGSSHTPPPPPPPPDDCTLAPAMPAGQPFTVSGVAAYDFVKSTYNPVTRSGGLTLATPVATPIRGADVQVRQCGNLLAGGTTTTDPVTGAYSVTFTPGAQGRVSVYVLARTANPPITVQDNTDGNAVWAVGAPITTTSPTLDVRATLGWTGSGYDSGSRIAAPFAILDDLYTASRRLLVDAGRNVRFDLHPLVVNWSPLNQPAVDSGTGDVNLPAGLIGTSHYDPNTQQIAILGASGVDTDEFDREVIVHEWGHYFEDNFSRADTPGGPHGFGDVLDPRLSFSEGWASGFAAILLQDRIYADSYWNPPLTAFGWDAETEPTAPNSTDDPSPGPFSEISVIRTVWDLWDAPSAAEPWDTAQVGLDQIYDALVGPERTTPALTTLASFITALKAQAVDAAAVDAVLAHCGGDQSTGTCIGPIASDWGDGDPNLRGIYTSITPPSGTPYTVTPTPTLNGGFAWNERPQNQYFVFIATGTHASFVATPAGPYDVDLYALQSGATLAWDERSYAVSATANVAFSTTPGQTYVIVLTGWGGVSSGQSSIGSYGVTLAVSN